jgi:hypothetical protein
MYYVMSCEGPAPVTPVDGYPKLPGGPWFTGAKLVFPVPQPLRFMLSSEYRGSLKALYRPNIPLMRTDLLQVLQEAGVDNLELFDAVLEDPVTGAKHHNYKAFNVLGLVAAADMEQSVRAPINESSEMIDVFFDSLVIDPTKTHDLLLFRLAQSVNAVIVHENVKEAVERQNIAGMVFYEPRDWAG